MSKLISVGKGRPSTIRDFILATAKNSSHFFMEMTQVSILNVNGEYLRGGKKYLAENIQDVVWNCLLLCPKICTFHHPGVFLEAWRNRSRISRLQLDFATPARSRAYSRDMLRLAIPDASKAVCLLRTWRPRRDASLSHPLETHGFPTLA